MKNLIEAFNRAENEGRRVVGVAFGSEAWAKMRAILAVQCTVDDQRRPGRYALLGIDLYHVADLPPDAVTLLVQPGPDAVSVFPTPKEPT